jgi:arsenate reductase (thioredoxin)
MVSARRPEAAERALALSAEQSGRVARGSHMLSDPTRVRLVSLILASDGGRAYVSELASQLGVSQPTVSHHVRKLAEDGVLEREFIGRQAWFSVAPARLDEVRGALDAGEESVTLVKPDVLERISADLAGRFRGTFSPETVARYVEESHALLAEKAKITRYLASLTARFAADRLTALAISDSSHASPGEVAGSAPEVLFVCVQNAGRSQMAAAILASLAGDSVRVRTAGSAPAGAVHPSVIAALDEIGVSIGGEFPKPLTDEVVRAADVVITMGCGDACPIYPGRRYLDWALTDPVDLPLAGVREVRDDIERRVRELMGELGL